jgi:hypothetical protein
MAHSKRRFRKSRLDRRVKRVRRKGRSLMSTASGPWILLGFWVTLFVAAALAVVFLVIPMFSQITENEPAPTMQPSEKPEDNPAAHSIQTTELGALQKEISPGVRYVGDTCSFNGVIAYSGGVDENGDPLLKNIYMVDLSNPENPEKLPFNAERQDLFSLDMNEKWLVFTDGSRAGGGFVKAYNRKDGTVVTVKEYFAGQPVLSLSGDFLAWTERTGTYMDKLYLCDLKTKEYITVATFEGSRYGQSKPSAKNGQLIWAESDAAAAQDGPAKSVIRYVDLSGGTGTAGTYQANMYVHDPVTNGKDWAWIDADHGMGARLYLAQNGGEPQLIADSVLTYGITDTFLAYNRNSSIYVYFLSDGYEQIVTPASESAMLANVSSDKVIWFETGILSRDVLKYAAIS